MNPSLTRNFVIISHIDHGKSTLADRFLELTGTVEKSKMSSQYLDLMELEKEKGITIKMQPVRMSYQWKSQIYIFNLIDTPGHADFSYEVSRALAAVEGAILLVDATKGIQAQTLSCLDFAKEQKLTIIPVINKIDSPQARVEEAKSELAALLKISPEEIIAISAKDGINIEKVLEAVIANIPPPDLEGKELPLKALIFDSHYDSYKGVIAYVRIVEGKISQGEKIKLFAFNAETETKEIGYFKPALTAQKEILAGEIGYIATGIKEINKIRVGDTIMSSSREIESQDPLPGYKEPQRVVFASIYPRDPKDYETLKKALSQLKLNDAALSFETDFKKTLGQGFKCGFLGMLHAEIITERIRREFGIELVISTPSVVYKIIDKKDKENFIYSATDWPSADKINTAYEPWVRIEIVTPTAYWGKTMEVVNNLSGKNIGTSYISSDRLLLSYEVALREIITGFYDRLKGATQGYASMSYKNIGYREGDLVKMEVLIAGEKEEAFSKIVPKDKISQDGRALVKRLKEVLPNQLFSVALQAIVGGTIVARETISSKGKDVIASLYGGDYTRKRKLLEKQKKGKQKLKGRGKVKIPHEVFLEMFKK